ncbi:sulfatase family protein [Rubripirellula reticaptiva]|uniref:Arylsulfatase n=1 Tax=Rubripirellula reticaptiva TaxID=2528013 RepID=A0A5C6EHF9_9BACT|nr:sulfatase [Rubripirellula reticaptiva]TWU47980.1 Arylsulfatase [Rubripirellula reticaptiva]
MRCCFRFLWFAFFTSSILCLTRATAQPSVASDPPRLNLLVIMADDLGYGDLGCYGSSVHRTPHIDRLADEGMRFTDFYVTSSVCTPTRAAFLTGRLPRRCGSPGVLWPTSTEDALPNVEVTLAELLQDAGYATHLSGKWHLGHGKPEHLPQAHGFDHWYGMPYPNDMTAGHPQETRRREAWPPMPMMLDGEIVEQPINVNLLTQQYTADAVNFISKHHDRPFFLFLAHAMPHAIIGASPDFVSKSQNGLYGDSIEEIDWSTGEVMRALKAFGIDDTTLVLFTSDNGATHHVAHQPDEVQRWFCADMTSGSNAPLRGGKQATFEGGVRVPGIFRLPGVIAPGKVESSPAIITDILPTMLDYLKIPLPAERVYDGRTIRPVLESLGSRDETDFIFGGNEATGIRSGKWKLQLPKQPSWMLPKLESDQPLLFDLNVDIGESNNIAEQHPEIVKQLLRKMQTYEAETETR